MFVPPGFFAIVVSAIVVAAAAVHQGVDLTYIHSNFLQLATASLLISVLLSIYLYIRSCCAGPDQQALGGNSGKCEDREYVIIVFMYFDHLEYVCFKFCF